jgi:hypothetical protein
MMDYTIQNYFVYPQYFKIDDKPVFMVWSHNNLIDALGVGGTKNLFDEWRQMSINAGHDGIFIAVLHPWALSYSELSEIGTDGFTAYHYSGWGFTNTSSFPWHGSYDNLVDVYQTRYELTYNNSCGNNNSIKYILPVTPGWDNTPWHGNSSTSSLITNSTPEKFKLMLENAKNFSDVNNIQPKIIISEAWDEWGEGSVLAPTKRWGTQYLDKIADVFGVCRDLDGSGSVNIIDLVLVIFWQGKNSGDPDWSDFDHLDVNGDLVIGFDDTYSVISHMGQAC